jgi:site-specific DNA-cytosine methylase
MYMYIVDLFCGLGGFSCGAAKAGHKIVLAIDNWDVAVKAHKYNHPNTVHYTMELGEDLLMVKNLIYAHIPKNSN